MYAARVSSLRPLTGSQSTTVSKIISKNFSGNPVIQTTSFLLGSNQQSHRRNFSSSPRAALEYFPPPHDSKHIKVTPPAWHHPGYTEQQMHGVSIAHREPRSWQDRIAKGMVNFLRYWTDKATGYHHEMEVQTAEKSGKKGYAMNERKWMIRFIFLETVAGNASHLVAVPLPTNAMI